MKVLFRMLASILPGIIVGLGVIAYLEREQLQLMWTGEEMEEEGTAVVEPPSQMVAPIRMPDSSDDAVVTGDVPLSTVNAEKVEAHDVVTDRSRASDSERSPLPAPVVPNPEEVKPPQPIRSRPDLNAVIGIPSGSDEEKVTAVVPLAPHSTPNRAQQSGVEHESRRPVSDYFSGAGEREESRKPPVSRQSMGELASQFDLQPQPLGVDGEKSEGDSVWTLAQGEGGSDHGMSESQWLWNRGRQSFWEGDIEGAIENYRALLEAEPKNPDAWGELGNIYYANKDWVRAVRAFGRAAATLIDAGRRSEAEKVIRVIKVIDPALAAKLSAEPVKSANKTER